MLRQSVVVDRCSRRGRGRDGVAREGAGRGDEGERGGGALAGHGREKQTLMLGCNMVQTQSLGGNRERGKKLIRAE